MLISVLGNIIDTKKIYLITPISEEYYGSYLSGTKDLCDVSNRFFSIKFFNEKQLDIYFSPFNLIEAKIKNGIYPPRTNENSKKALEIIITLRNKIIDKWNQSKSEIELIEFEF